ncbi:restriction endonuclease subunit S [Desulfolutivibrio sulfoxidireducens]|uniref:restriction endonuclease subunit S n=1 Tax=Desulfolutivibrio sulfoxidireducens TaxID=2773299 RepID=UPI00159DB0CB|nr:restriction endonuclease subunit S [Desulfolutivibrio sulfoxidireducens]QLA20900.1 restriction endonuclease subunit S [Desulfolutivibrio sulfoxidireducens]
MSTQSLKPGWKMVKFGDVAQNVAVRVDPADAKTDVYVGLEHLDPSTIHLRQWGHPTDVTGQKLAFKKGDVIFGRRRAYQRKLAVAEFDGICSAHAMVVRAKPKMILPEFLPFFLQSDMFMERAIEISVGSLSPTINWKTLKVQEFPLPPIDEQKRIAEILWAADEAIEKYLATSNRLQQLRNSIWENIFRSDDTPWSTIGTIARVGNGTTPSRKNNDFWEGGTVPWLSSGKIHDRIIQSADEYITPAALKKAKSSHFPAGSVLVAMIGQGKTRGTAAFLGIDACINQNMAAIVPTEKSDGKYVFYCLDQMYEKLRNWSHGSNQGALNCGLVAKFKIPLPSAKQRAEIGEISSQIETELVRAANHVEALRETLKMISTHFMNEASRSLMTVKKEASHV